MKQKGFSLVEAMMVLGLMAAAGVAVMTFMQNQSKVSNRMEYVNLRDQLRSTLLSQFLTSSESCKCVFEGATFNKVGVTSEINFSNGVIGRRHFATSGNCATSTVPFKLVSTNEVINGLQALDIKLKDVQEVSGSYMANFQVRIETPKNIIGVRESLIQIPVILNTQPDADPTKLRMNGCSLSGGGGMAGSPPRCRLVYEIFEHNGCNGKSSFRHSDWTDEGTPGDIKWTYRDSSILYTDPQGVGSPVATRNGRNYITADVSCARIGIQCL